MFVCLPELPHQGEQSLGLPLRHATPELLDQLEQLIAGDRPVLVLIKQVKSLNQRKVLLHRIFSKSKHLFQFLISK